MVNGKEGRVDGIEAWSFLAEMSRKYAVVKKYQSIGGMDVLEGMDEDKRIVIYPCINAVLMGDSVRELLNTFSEEDYVGEEAAVQGTIEDLSE